MIESIGEFRDRLKVLDPWADDFVIDADKLIESLAPQIEEFVYPAVFEFFEAAPEADCGAPGSLVHHVERFYPNYMPSLRESVRRLPSYNGVLMINRVLNSELPESEWAELMALLASVASCEDVSAEISQLAGRFVERQRKIKSEQGGASDGDEPSC